jgi:hypothetical protein
MLIRISFEDEPVCTHLRFSRHCAHIAAYGKTTDDGKMINSGESCHHFLHCFVVLERGRLEASPLG